MHIKMPRLRDAQSGSGELHSAHKSFPGISRRMLETESAGFTSILSAVDFSLSILNTVKSSSTASLIFPKLLLPKCVCKSYHITIL